MQRPEALWQQFPLDPAPSPGEVEQGIENPAEDVAAVPTPEPAATAQEGAGEGAATDDAADGRIVLPGGAEITYPAANGSEQAITSTPPAPAVATRPPAAQAGSGDPVDVSGQAGLYVLLVAVLVVLMARWLLNHTWRAALTVAVMVLGVAMLGLILMRWATDLGIVS